MNIYRFDQIKGALYGVAIGDALGGPLEFMSAAEINKKHGIVKDMIGGGWLNLKPGETTDDTAMTLAVAQGIVENVDNPVPAIGKRFINWYKSGPKDIGITCGQAIRAAMQIDDTEPNKEIWMQAGLQVKRISNGKNAGNGAVMRTIYPALYYPDIFQAINIAVDIGNMTHNNETSAYWIERYIRYIHGFITGNKNLVVGIEYIPESPSGYVVDTMYYAIKSYYKKDNFEDSLIWAVNKGGDADTIGAIAGGMLGAVYGYSSIPARWINALDPIIKTELDNLAMLAEKRWKEYF